MIFLDEWQNTEEAPENVSITTKNGAIVRPAFVPSLARLANAKGEPAKPGRLPLVGLTIAPLFTRHFAALPVA